MVGVQDDAGNLAGSVKTFTPDTQVLPPVAVLVETTHADMTEAEAASAFDVTVEAGAQWTVELTGTNYANALQVQAQSADVTSAQDAKRAADDAVPTAAQSSPGWTRSSGRDQWPSDPGAALSEAVTRQGEAQTNANQAQQAYDTAFEAAEIQP